MLTGHIVDGLTTQSRRTSEQAVPTPRRRSSRRVARGRARAPRRSRSAEPNWSTSSEEGPGRECGQRQSFVDAVLKNKSVESLGFDKKDYDRIVAIK